jgi:hypothetical protein
MLLPVIFQIAERPDGIFSFYYLSPITLWRSLEPQDFIEEGGPRYLLYGVRIIYVAMGLFGFSGVLFTALGILQARRARHPLLRLEPEAV